MKRFLKINMFVIGLMFIEGIALYYKLGQPMRKYEVFFLMWSVVWLFWISNGIFGSPIVGNVGLNHKPMLNHTKSGEVVTSKNFEGNRYRATLYEMILPIGIAIANCIAYVVVVNTVF